MLTQSDMGIVKNMIGGLFGKMGLGVIIVLITLYMYVQASFVFGEFAEIAKGIMLTYIVLGITVLTITGARLRIFSASPAEFIWFTAGMIITFILVSILPKSIGTATLASFELQGIGFGFLWAFVKSFWEEVIFRGALVNISTGIFAPLAIGSNLLFGAFHFGIMGVTFWGVIILVVLGIAWTFMARRWGLMSAVGSHFGYNMWALGLI